MFIRNYWIILILIVLIKLIKDKPLSSYNIKWLVVYTVYVVWVHAEGGFDFNSKYIDSEIKYYILSVFILPLAVYLLFPFIWRFLIKWRVFGWVENIIDKWYNTIKNLN